VVVVDVHYPEAGGAIAAGVVARHWGDASAADEQVVAVADVQPYRSGAFFERELPCLLAVLAAIRSPYRAVLIDGYVDLDEHGAPGLGAHLYEALGGTVSVIGAAKRAYAGSAFAVPVLRGDSRRPLYVTARGLPVSEAASLVRGMHGESRIPTLVKRLDPDRTPAAIAGTRPPEIVRCGCSQTRGGMEYSGAAVVLTEAFRRLRYDRLRSSPTALNT
jgi:deoxyribonuclease V